MKRIYFVRHGETNANRERVVQGPEEPLSLEGERQAEKIAERSKNISFQKIITSDFVRASQTAAAIGKANHMEVEHSPLFRERLGPSRFFGKPNTHPDFLAFLTEEHAHLSDSAWHFENAENHYDVMDRASKALDYLKEDTNEEILVVTHGLFLKYLVGVVIFGEKFAPDACESLYWGISHTNTGITICKFDDFLNRWRLLTWNDHAHFAE